MLLAEDELSELSVVLRRWILAEREPIIGIKKGCFKDLHCKLQYIDWLRWSKIMILDTNKYLKTPKQYHHPDDFYLPDYQLPNYSTDSRDYQS